MKSRVLATLLVLALAVTVGAVGASADQITLGGSGVGAVTFSTLVAGSTISMVMNPSPMGSNNSGSFESPDGNTIQALEPWSFTGAPNNAITLSSTTGTSFAVNMNGAVWNFVYGVVSASTDYVTGTVSWYNVSDSTHAPKLVGTLLVTGCQSVDFVPTCEFIVGQDYAIDITLNIAPGVLQDIWNGTPASSPSTGGTSSGEVVVPEPATLSLFGSGLVSLVGILRRRMK